MLRSALTVAQLPARLTRDALRRATSPTAVNALSMAIARGSIETADSENSFETDGLSLEFELNDERLLTTAGVSTVISMGSLYWIGSKLNLEFRYAAIVAALEDLQGFLAVGDAQEAQKTLDLIDTLSDPLIDPETLAKVENSEDVKVLYETLFDRPATKGSMFNASKFVSGIDETIEAGSRIGFALASSQTDEVLEVMIKKAKPLAGKATGRVIGAILWVDTVWWLGTSALDLGLNYLGIDEENQRIPILSDIPVVGALFDLSSSVGSSAVDIVVSGLLDGILGLFLEEDEVQVLVDALFGIIISASLNPTIAPFILAVLDFYIDDVRIEFEVPASFNLDFEFEGELDLLKLFRPEPLDILIVWLYAIVAKIVFKAWLRPAYRAIVKK